MLYGKYYSFYVYNNAPSFNFAIAWPKSQHRSHRSLAVSTNILFLLVRNHSAYLAQLKVTWGLCNIESSWDEPDSILDISRVVVLTGVTGVGTSVKLWQNWRMGRYYTHKMNNICHITLVLNAIVSWDIRGWSLLSEYFSVYGEDRTHAGRTHFFPVWKTSDTGPPYTESFQMSLFGVGDPVWSTSDSYSKYGHTTTSSSEGAGRPSLNILRIGLRITILMNERFSRMIYSYLRHSIEHSSHHKFYTWCRQNTSSLRAEG